jgi:hypothetical protein
MRAAMGIMVSSYWQMVSIQCACVHHKTPLCPALPSLQELGKAAKQALQQQ